LLILGALGCSGSNATDSTCPPATDLSYETFAQPFMENYCTGCHSSTLTGSARSGAPAGYNFDTLEGIRLRAQAIDETAAAGPSAVNTYMPPNGGPSEEERRKLGQWLACDLASQ
jgi:uncharacterized membrane protein